VNRRRGARKHPIYRLGLADYFIAGFPDHSGIGKRSWGAVEEDKRKECYKWSHFVKLFTKVVDFMEERDKKKDINWQICMGLKGINNRAPSTERRDGKSPQKLYSMDAEETVIFSEDELAANQEYEVVFKKEDDEELPSLIETEDEPEGEGIGEASSTVMTQEELYHFVSTTRPQGGDEKGVCYEMLFKNKCDRPQCMYSHREEDLAKARKLRAMKLSTQTKTGGKQVSFSKSMAPSHRKV